MSQDLDHLGGTGISLTTTRVYGTQDRGFFGSDETTIPLDAISSISFGWSRNPVHLVGGVLTLIVAGLLQLLAHGRVLTNDGSQAAYTVSIVFLCLGVGCLVLFAALRAARVEIRSATGSLIARPTSIDEARRFVDRLLHMRWIRERLGQTP